MDRHQCTIKRLTMNTLNVVNVIILVAFFAISNTVSRVTDKEPKHLSVAATDTDGPNSNDTTAASDDSDEEQHKKQSVAEFLQEIPNHVKMMMENISKLLNEFGGKNGLLENILDIESEVRKDIVEDEKIYKALMSK